MNRCEHLVKTFDQEILKQLKERSYEVHQCKMTEEEKIDKLYARVINIEKSGILRNRKYYEFMDDKHEYEEAKKLFQSEVSLALTDGLITDTGDIK